MAIDIGILVILAACALHGYSQGLVRGVASFASIILSLLLAIQACDDVARLFAPKPSTPVILLCFFALLGLQWLSLYLLQKLLNRAVNPDERDWLDQFLGGAFGLGRGVAVVWLAVAMLVSAVPASERMVERSRVSSRLLDVSGRPGPTATEYVPAGDEDDNDSTGVKCAVALRGHFSQYGPGH
jgi:uncharacterized membrane protein required for colicin V production